MENLGDLLFEISNEDRLRILLQLEKNMMNVTNLSKVLSLTTQECSRHISRLGKVGLTQKDAEGFYCLTSYGNLILRQFLGLEFISKNRDYFTYHSLERLPQEFIDRIGDLQNSTITDDIMVILHRVREGMKEAEKYIWAIVDQYPLSTVPIVREAQDRGVKIRTIEPKDWIAPPEFYDIRAKAEKEWVSRARRMGLVEQKVVEEVDIFLYMTEKEVSALAFPTLDGKFDYLGFASIDERAHKWCRDLFRFYWEKADSLDSNSAHST